MAKQKKLTDKQIQQNKTDLLMRTIARRCAYYRANPSRFIQDFIPGLTLKWFQKILLWAMANFDAFLFLAARSLGDVLQPA